jgi:hypothetical protein
MLLFSKFYKYLFIQFLAYWIIVDLNNYFPRQTLPCYTTLLETLLRSLETYQCGTQVISASLMSQNIHPVKVTVCYS